MGMFTWRTTSPSAKHIVDEDHSDIHEKLEALRSSIIGGKGLDTMMESAETLIRATVHHFVQEEKVLVTIKYPAFAAHKAQHRAIGSKLAEMRHGLEKRQIQAVLNLLKFYDTAIKQHETEDAKYHHAINLAIARGVLGA